MSFSISCLQGAEPSVANLAEFENKEFKNVAKKAKKIDNKSRVPLKVYNQDSDDDESDILGAYVCITPKVSKLIIVNLLGIFSSFDDKKVA